jgi:hypothetical protein
MKREEVNLRLEDIPKRLIICTPHQRAMKSRRI